MYFTEKAVKSLKPTDKRFVVLSENENGFALRVTPTGKKTWLSRYRDRVSGKQVWITLGTYPGITLAEARAKHQAHREAIRKGKDPRSHTQTKKKLEHEAPTVEQFIDEFATHYKPKKKDGRPPSERYLAENVRILKKDVMPAWGNLKVKDITRRQIVTLLDHVKARSQVSANNLHARLSMFFNFAVKRGIPGMDVSPFINIDVPAHRNKRGRILDNEEVKIVWNTIGTLPIHNNLKEGLKLLLLTAQRRSEVTFAEKSEFDINAKEWVIPSTRTKNGMTQVVPLSRQALKIINQLFEQYPNTKWLLPSSYGEDQPFSERALSRAVRNNEAQFTANDGKPIPHWSPHDLRRTATTIMTGQCKIDRFIVRKVLNHKEPKEFEITDIYDRHEYIAEKRLALQKLADKIDELLNENHG